MSPTPSSRGSGTGARERFLCITRGGADVGRTALFDEGFTLSPAPFVITHYHAQYPAAFRSTRPAERPDEADVPQWAPIYSLSPMPLPHALKSLSYETLDGALFSRDLEGPRGLPCGSSRKAARCT
jgi:hypothetical protein